ncbi:MAG: SCO family protein [Thiohalorhabdaceae bacterium]
MKGMARLAGTVAAVATLFLMGCAPDQDGWRLTNITGLMPELAFTLTDHNGERVTGESFRGRPVLMYFVYTHCPDVCPTTLATVRRALGRLEKGADKVRVLFVTVDPDRDDRATLSRYVNAFGPQFVGLRGQPEQLKALTRRYRVVYNRDKPDADGDYRVAHSSALFVFDRKGRPRLVARPDDDAAAIAADLNRLLAET